MIAHHFALGAIVVEKQILLFQFFSLLEFQFFGLLLHLLEQHFAYASGVSFQDFACLFDVLSIGLDALFANARPIAAVKMEFKTSLVLVCFDRFWRDREETCARLIQLIDELEQSIHRGDVAIRPIKGTHSLVNLPGFEDAR